MARAGENVASKRCPECSSRFGAGSHFCPFCGERLVADAWDPKADPLIGTRIDNRYEVLAALGQGGMGVVYEVRHRVLDKPFALKVLRREFAHDAALAERFLVEARAVASIKHPNVVEVTDFGRLEDGSPYFVMDRVAGVPLAKVIRERKRLDVETSVDIARKLCEGLAAAHAAGVVHRDLKPDNIFLSRGAEPHAVRIVDFGAAKIMGTNRITKTGMVFGTPYYMSPEQASGQPVDGRADIYALGVVLFEMITGRVPFDAETFMGVMTKHMFAEPPRPSSMVPDGVVVGPVETVILRALAKTSAARYQTAEEMEVALAVAARGSTTPKVERSSPVKVASPSLSGMSSADRIELSIARQVLEDDQRRRRRIASYAILASAAVICVVTASAWILDRAPQAAPRPFVLNMPPSAPVASAARVVPEMPSSAPPVATASSSAVRAPPSAAAPSHSSPVRVAHVPPVARGSDLPVAATPSDVVPTAPPPPAVTEAPSAAPDPTRSPVDLPDPWGKDKP